MALRDRKKDGFDDKVLDVDASMQGTLSFKDPVNLRINGKFEGNLETRGILTIGPEANVEAHIVGEDVVIAGRVKGEILAKKRLSLQSTAVVEGKVRTAKLSIQEGAILEADCKMLHDLLNPQELAQYLEVDVNSVLEWATSGKMPGQKEGSNWRFERQAIDEWVASGKIK